MDPAKHANRWQGYSAIEYIFIFGASTSDVGYRAGKNPDPSPEEPLGIEYPGLTWAGNDKANWVGHLINKYTKGKPLVYDYAVGGHTMPGYIMQIRRDFAQGAGAAEKTVPWDATNSLFISSIGGNDVADPAIDLEDSLTKLFAIQEVLYEAGARNFLFFNIAPLPRPEDPKKASHPLLLSRETKCQEWNSLLPKFANDFAISHSDTSVFVFDTYSCTWRMLDDPAKYDFPEDAGRMYDGEMYIDNIHPTTSVHEVYAKELASFLYGEDVGEGFGEKYSNRIRAEEATPPKSAMERLKATLTRR